MRICAYGLRFSTLSATRRDATCVATVAKMTSIVSPENGPFTSHKDTGWSADQANCVDAEITPSVDTQITTVKQEDEEIQHYTMSLDKNTGSGAESEPLTPESETTNVSEAGSTTLAMSCTATPEDSVQLLLENEELWTKFSSLGTEMIITKAGRYDYYNTVARNSRRTHSSELSEYML